MAFRRSFACLSATAFLAAGCGDGAEGGAQPSRREPFDPRLERALRELGDRHEIRGARALAAAVLIAAYRLRFSDSPVADRRGEDARDRADALRKLRARQE